MTEAAIFRIILAGYELLEAHLSTVGPTADEIRARSSVILQGLADKLSSTIASEQAALDEAVPPTV